MKQNAIFLIALVFMTILTGCGYTFRGSGSALPPDVKAIYIPQVDNNSTKLGLATVLTDAIRDEFDSYGSISVVDNQNQADAVLKVTIVDVKETTSAVRANTNTSLQMQTTMFLTAELRRVTGAVLWRDNQIRVTQTFGADSSVVVTSSAAFAGGSISSGDLSGLSSREISRGQEASALNSLSETAARQMYDKAIAPDF
jgi:outer membrane lipopolysaccharide assembly protein LptE/RlpB